MKKILCLVVSIATSFIVNASDKIRVACIGNSITYGAGITNREKNSYPAQLQYFLGDDYRVRNFGVNGRTMLLKGDLPYVKTEQYKQSLEYNPDIVIIKLGTNDSKPQNKIYLSDDYQRDYDSLIDTYKSLPSKPRIILLTPVRCYLSEEQFSTQSFTNIIIPSLERLAVEKKCEIINLYSILDTQWQEQIMPDKLHPSSIGAGLIAQKIGNYILNSDIDTTDIDLKRLNVGNGFNFHGFSGFDFKMKDVDCKIVTPKHTRQGAPWIWRARFWGHEPQTDIALLENGFHVVYCDVADLYGSEKAVDRWNKFYKLMTSLGLNKKVALEGMSRGGLIVYNWAAQNLEKVACIYADAPVLDFKSWPMGRGTSSGSLDDTRKLMMAYGFENESEALNWRNNPIDNAAKLAKADIPLLHVVGDADVVVPIDENTQKFENVVKQNGGNIQVIHKPNVGHHPHSLTNPSPIVDFIMKAYGYYQNPCVKPLPGNEYRSGAGWVEGNDWNNVADEISNILIAKNVDILLIGNSITQGLGGSRKLVTHKPGKVAADNAFAKLTWESAGISGDRTQNILWRLKYGNYDVAKPKTAVITIGINNLNAGDDPSCVAEGVIAVAKQALESLPDTKIILFGPLPAGADNNDLLRIKTNAVHSILANFKFDNRITYVNPSAWFVNDDGSLKKNLFTNDNLHLDTEGYNLWVEKIKFTISR